MEADLSSQAGDDAAQDPGGDPGVRRAGLDPGGPLRDFRADCLELAQAGRRPRLQSHVTQAADNADAGSGSRGGALRRTLLLPLDDLLVVVREFLNPNMSRSGLDRCLRRHGASRLQDLKPKKPKPAH